MHSIAPGFRGEDALRLHRFPCLIWLLALLILDGSRAGADYYQILDLGTLTGEDRSFGIGLNDRGQVVGTASTGMGSSHGFLASDGLLYDLKALPGGRNSEAKGINSWGEVVGRSEVQVDGRLTTHAFVATVDPSGLPTLLDLGTLRGGTWSEATAINDSGLVVGVGDVSGGRSHAFLGSVGGLLDLGTLGGANSRANAINDRGVVTGWSGTSSGEIHAFRGDASGGLVDLGVLPGATFSVGQAINLSGQVAGYSSGLGFGTHAFVTDADGRLIDLGVPTGAGGCRSRGGPASRGRGSFPRHKLLAASLLRRFAPALTLGTGVRDEGMTRDPSMLALRDSDTLRHSRICASIFYGMAETADRVAATADRIRIPTLMILGEADPLIDPSTSRAVFERLGSTDKTLRIYPEMLHEPLCELDRERVISDLSGWLDEHLHARPIP